MRKLILCLVFVVATGTITNADSNKIVIAESNMEMDDPFSDCDTFATVAGKLFRLSYEEEHNLFSFCMDVLG